jgi:Calcineurin-like phosphoesterase
MPRTIAIGDIHGCAIALAKLIEVVAPQPDDTVVPLGDYVDRGIDSRGVIDQLISLADHCRLVPILGNHEEMLLGAREGRSDFRFWINCGGITCLVSPVLMPARGSAPSEFKTTRFLFGGGYECHEDKPSFLRDLGQPSLN